MTARGNDDGRPEVTIRPGSVLAELAERRRGNGHDGAPAAKARSTTTKKKAAAPAPKRTAAPRTSRAATGAPRSPRPAPAPPAARLAAPAVAPPATAPPAPRPAPPPPTPTFRPPPPPYARAANWSPPVAHHYPAPPPQRSGLHPLAIVGIVIGGVVALIVLLGVIGLVFGEEDPSPAEIRQEVEEAQAENPPPITADQVFTAPGYTFVDVPEATAAVREGMAAELPEGYIDAYEDFVGRRAEQNGEPVAFVGAFPLPTPEGKTDMVRKSFLRGAENGVGQAERVTVGGEEAVVGTVDDVEMLVTYKNGIALVVAGASSRAQLESLTAALLATIPS